MDSTLDQIALELSTTIAKTLHAYRLRIDEPIKILALDVHPWNGFIALALLTESEVQSDPLLDDPSEMAAWKYYDFGTNLSEWNVTSVSEEMRRNYEKNEDSQSLFRCCASAMASPSVQDAIGKYILAPNFRISIADPDSNQEYYTG